MSEKFWLDRKKCFQNMFYTKCINVLIDSIHGLQSLPPSPKRAERKGRRRPFQEAGSGHKQWNTVSCVDTFSIISKFSVQNSKIKECYASGNCSSYP